MGLPAEACRFGCSPANPPVATFTLSAGCLVYPEDRAQALCLHHAMRATPRGAMRLAAVLPGVPAAVRAVLARRYGGRG